ncbi:DnaB-like helicase C-terminal domain-containing protein [Telmatospirillum sp. J64-1]|uniref:DnaB-like helicase C-terminal domain-containing protein n=1 Tax=Telmatospirillum sp. J64-1 TaxID=2502183 RepID=UPI001C8F2BA0|nr:DnaB-like helicase C-terminal domain-containing protein [Telmatospirillum sp. J64-1]
MSDLLQGEVRALNKRGINEATCRKFGYRVATFNGQTVQVADYWDPEGKAVVAQKVRFANKDFRVLGDIKQAGLFGQHLWRDRGKMIVVTEGEIDALTVSQLQDNKWPVVSIPNGAQGAKKTLSKHLDWLLGFDTIVLFFDNDEPGRKAVEECASLFPPGRCKVARMASFKDPNEALQANKGGEVIDAIWGAKAYRPDGIVSGSDLWDSLINDDELVETVPYPWDGLNEITRGLRKRELVTVTAGSGIGKSAIVREIGHHLIRDGETLGMLMLEESTKRTAKGLMGIALNKPIHLDLTPWSELSDEEREARRAAYEATVGSGRLFLYDHFGSTEIENLLNRVRYLVKGCGCGWIILDHLSIVVSGLDDGDERKAIDVAMTKLRTLIQETGCGMIMVSHLKRPEGRGHEEGAKTSLAQLRGSHAIAQLSDIVLGAERDQQGENPNITLIRVLKNRFTGQTGPACYLKYDPETGRLSETHPALDEREQDDGEDEF